MVANVTSLTGNGLKDWLIQRFSALYLAFYVIFLTIFFVRHTPMTFADWHLFFSCMAVKVATLIAFFMILLHAWIGLWTVATDYMKCAYVRLSFLMILAIWLTAQFIWGILIIWGQ